MNNATIGVSVRGLTVARLRRRVLEDVSFSAPSGSLTAVLGPAGAGKTTLLAAMAGLLPVERGAVFRDGADVTRAPARRRGIGLLPPGSMLPEASTIQAALRKLAGRSGAGAVEARLVALGLDTLATQPAGLLTHGEAMLALTAARAGVAGGVLLVDEAGMGLDEQGRRRLLALLRHEAASRLVVLATRYPATALAADQLVLLAGGRVLQTGTPASVYAEPHDAVAALLTGPANILQGTVRELRPGGFVWAAGSRHVQAAGADAPRPALGSPVVLCLRPERLALLNPGERADNELDGMVADMRSAGPLLDLSVTTRLGGLLVAAPSWKLAPYPSPGQPVRLGWATDAAIILTG